MQYFILNELGYQEANRADQPCICIRTYERLKITFIITLKSYAFHCDPQPRSSRWRTVCFSIQKWVELLKTCEARLSKLIVSVEPADSERKYIWKRWGATITNERLL